MEKVAEIEHLLLEKPTLGHISPLQALLLMNTSLSEWVLHGSRRLSWFSSWNLASVHNVTIVPPT
jgi:hypothetical protein